MAKLSCESDSRDRFLKATYRRTPIRPISPDLSPPFRMEWRSKQPAVPLAMNSDALQTWRYWLGRPESDAEERMPNLAGTDIPVATRIRADLLRQPERRQKSGCGCASSVSDKSICRSQNKQND